MVDGLNPGDSLGLDGSITSANRRFTLVYQGDGNLVLYGPTRWVWQSGTHGRPAGICIMQGDGNLVIYDLDGRYIWDSETHNNPGSRLLLQPDGNLVIYGPLPDERVVWATYTIEIPAEGDDMQPGHVLYPDQSVRSANRRFTLVYQGDGNLVLYGPTRWVWQSGTAGIPGAVCIMQGDGNLVISDSNNQWIWDSETHNNPGSRLFVQDDGKLVIYNAQNVPVWQTTKNKGVADIHNHQFANLGFGGGGALWGHAYGDISTQLRWCNDSHGWGGTNDTIDKVMSAVYKGSPRPGHLVGGNPQFDGWPRWDSYTHQSVYEDWLYRAWKGGLRLMVMLAVNNEFMCNLVRKAPGRTCNDMEAVDYQLRGAKNMQAYIDEKWGGPGRGWYRIVKTSDEAQAVIDAGKLAVVLGIEVDYLFGSYLPAIHHPVDLNQLDKYYDLGVRHLFPIHFSDNAFGGLLSTKICSMIRT